MLRSGAHDRRGGPKHGLWLIGENPLRTDFLWQSIYARLRDHGQKGVVVEGLSGVDIALWDIKGKRFGVPVHQLLGGAFRTEVQAYATGLYRQKSGDPLRYLAEEAAGYVAEGFKAVKLKVGFGVEEDAAVTCAVRFAIGADVALMVDANHAYDAVSAIRLGRKIEEYDIGWFEEPVPPEDLAGYRAVKAALRSRSQVANVNLRGLVSANCWFRTRWTLSSQIHAQRVDCPNARRSLIWLKRSASGTILMSGEQALRSLLPCTFWPASRHIHQLRLRPFSRCWSSTGQSTQFDKPF